MRCLNTTKNSSLERKGEWTAYPLVGRRWALLRADQSALFGFRLVLSWQYIASRAIRDPLLCVRVA